MAKVLDALPPGSYLAVSHLGSDLLDQEAKQGFENVVSRSAQQQYIGRSREEMAPVLRRARTWSSPGWCGSRNGGPTLARRGGPVRPVVRGGP